jgi:hypothetical protein
MDPGVRQEDAQQYITTSLPIIPVSPDHSLFYVKEHLQ